MREAANGHEGLESILTTVPDLIVTDLKMPAGGFDYIHRLRTFAPECPIIVMTAFGEPHTRAEALKSGATAYVDKPVRLAELKLLVRQLLDRQPGQAGEAGGQVSGSPEVRRPGVVP